MRTINLIALIVCLLPFVGNTQHISNINTYNNSVALSINNTETARYIIGSYGELISVSTLNSDPARYLFQHQEYDEDLNLVLFPNRLYSPKEKRFYQPDPASQYFSSYSFVGGDPINYIDKDGNEGKPIVFYAEDTDVLGDQMGAPGHIQSMMDAGVDAYYIPANSLLEDMSGFPLEEWNGNVFIQGHTSRFGDYISESRSHKSPAKLRYKGKLDETRVVQGDSDIAEITMVQPEHLADKLIDVSEKNGVPLKNITIDGCESEGAAQRMSMRLQDRMAIYKQGKFRKPLPDRIEARGLRDHRFSHWSDSFTDKTRKFETPSTDIHMGAGSATSAWIEPKDIDGAPRAERHLVDKYWTRQPTISGAEEFSNYANGRIAKNMKPFYNTFHVSY